MSGKALGGASIIHGDVCASVGVLGCAEMSVVMADCNTLHLLTGLWGMVLGTIWRKVSLPPVCLLLERLMEFSS